MKSLKDYTLNERQLIARFGKSALHPLCQKALRHWRTEALYTEITERAREAKKIRDDLKKRRREAAALANWCADHKLEEVVWAAATLKKIDNEFLPKAEEWYEANRKFLSSHDWKFDHAVASVLFDLEREKYKRDNQAQKALQRTQNRWDKITAGKPLKRSDARTLSVLQALHDKKIRAAWAIAGPISGWHEITTGGNRPLSNEDWHGLLTASKIAGATGIDVREVRLIANRLGLGLAQEKRGRKLKGPFSKNAIPPKTKKPLGRVELVPVENIDGIQLSEAWEELVSAEPDAINLRKEAETLKGQIAQMFRSAQKLNRASRYQKPRR